MKEKQQVKSKQRVVDRGEVFTAEREVNAMLDLVKQETERIDSRFLEPACGDGNFLSEILKRKLFVVEKKYKENAHDCEKYSLLALMSIYGIDIMSDNVADCRRRLFDIWKEKYNAICKKNATEKTERAAEYILNKNIICGNTLTTMLVDKKCNDTKKYITFSEWSFAMGDKVKRRDFRLDQLLNGSNQYERNIRISSEFASETKSFIPKPIAEYFIPNYLNLQDFEQFHTTKPEEIWSMRFDVIIGNPPYQFSTGDTTTQATPLYDKFVMLSKKLSPRFLIMITPSRWFSGGMGLDKYRKSMLSDKSIRKIVDYPNAKECFPDINISGGVSYFLWNRDNKGACEFTNVLNGKEITLIRDLNEFETFVRYNEAISIVRKVLKFNERKLSEVGGCSSQTPFGFLSTFKGSETPTSDDDCKILSSKGWGYVNNAEVNKGRNLINRYKPMISKLSCEHAGNPDKNGMYRVLSRMEILEPNEICNQSYLVITDFDNFEMAKNSYDYLRTKFVRFLILQTLTSINISTNSFKFVPFQDFSKPWTDEELYEKYNLTQEEIDFIESMIKPMNLR